MQGLEQELEQGAALSGAGGHGSPDPLAPATASFAASALGDLAVDHHEAESLLHRVVGRLHARRVQEAEVMFGMLAKSLGDVAGLATDRRVPRHVEHVALGRCGGELPPRRRFPLTVVPDTLAGV